MSSSNNQPNGNLLHAIVTSYKRLLSNGIDTKSFHYHEVVYSKYQDKSYLVRYLKSYFNDCFKTVILCYKYKQNKFGAECYNTIIVINHVILIYDERKIQRINTQKRFSSTFYRINYLIVIILLHQQSINAQSSSLQWNIFIAHSIFHSLYQTTNEQSIVIIILKKDT